MCYQKSTQDSEEHVLGVILGPPSNAVVGFLLSVHFDSFCKTVTEVKPHLVKSVKITYFSENSIDGGKNFSMGVFLDSLSNAVVSFLLSVHFDPFCKTVTEVKPHLVKSVKIL